MHSSRTIFDHSGDRFIPLRTPDLWKYSFVKNSDLCSTAYSNVLQNELFGDFMDSEQDKECYLQTSTMPNLFKFSDVAKNTRSKSSLNYSLYRVNKSSHKLRRRTVPEKDKAHLPVAPYKTLNVTQLQDNFYFNLIDWSFTNIVCVGSGPFLYFYKCKDSEVREVCTLLSADGDITSVSWSEKGSLLAVGTHTGQVQIWDIVKGICVWSFRYHSKRIGTLVWSGSNVWSGSGDCSIVKTDVLSQNNDKFSGHEQEVCNLKWSSDMQLLASGGNDNKLCIWNTHSKTPIQTHTKHRAAVKGLAWSPCHHGLLASGGGSRDICIRFWNVLTNQAIPQFTSTSAQITNLAWSYDASEIVSTHGYTTNDINIWKYPSMKLMYRSKENDSRVLYMSTSPNGESFVTGSADGKICFWNFFKKRYDKVMSKSALSLFSAIR